MLNNDEEPTLVEHKPLIMYTIAWNIINYKMGLCGIVYIDSL